MLSLDSTNDPVQRMNSFGFNSYPPQGQQSSTTLFHDYQIQYNCLVLFLCRSNIVATIQLKKAIKLEELVNKLRNAEYNPKVGYKLLFSLFQRFGALIVRIREPKCTALIFKSGKIVLAGTKSQNDVATAAKKFVDLLGVDAVWVFNMQRSLQNGVKIDENAKPTIHNMVAVGDCKFPIRLEGLSIDHIESTTVFLHIDCQYSMNLSYSRD